VNFNFTRTPHLCFFQKLSKELPTYAFFQKLSNKVVVFFFLILVGVFFVQPCIIFFNLILFNYFYVHVLFLLIFN
jgi:hypothetical protein